MSVGELLDAERRRSDSTLSQPIRQEGEEMPIPSNDNSRRWNYAFLCFVLILAASGYTGRTLAQESAPSGKIYVVTHVDIIPPETGAGTKLVQQYVSDSRKEKGLVRIECFAQVSRLNHISIVEVWQSQKDFDEHVAAAHTRQFRQQLDPKLGSPYDERLHQSLE
jgi:quinol monooxygenase YgiN